MPNKNINNEKADEIVRINTNLIQVEAIVKDKNGKIVDDLTVNDFEIVEDDGIRQPEYFSFVWTTGERERSGSPNDRLSAAELRRTFVFSIGNPAIDFGNIYHDRNGFRSGTNSLRRFSLRATETMSQFFNKFIDEQMGRRDLISVVDPEKNLGLLSSFTNDREMSRPQSNR